MIIAIGSKNPVKIQAVRNVFTEDEVISLSVPSGVSEQPFSDDETIEGAINRANNCLMNLDADIGIGLEGGVVQTKQGLLLCNWGALATRRNVYFAGGARIRVPDEVAARLLQGEELGPVMDDYAKKENVSKREGAIGVFTNEWMTRVQMFEHIMKLLVGQYEYDKK